MTDTTAGQPETRLIRVVDFETSAMEPPEAKVIEVGTCDLIGDATGWTINDPVSHLCGGVTSIDPGARAAHHISVRHLATFGPFVPRDFRAQIEADAVVVIAAHNAEFEAKFFEPPVPIICTYKCALRVWPNAPSHSNGALRYWLQDQSIIDPDHEKTMPAHRAGPDAYVTAHLLKALLVTTTAKQMVAWTKEPRLLPKCTIGKFRGKPWPEVEAGFLNWMLNQADMEADLKWNASRELERRKSNA